MLRSQELDTASWTLNQLQPFGSGSIANAITAPDGTTTADKLVENATASALHFAHNAVAVTTGTTYSISVFVKAAERSWVAVGVGGTGFGTHGLYVDLSTGTAGLTIGTPIATNIQAYPNGWYRVSVTQIATDTSGELQVRLASGNGGFTYTGDGTSGLYVWGAQLENGTFATSYIPTAGTTATRVADRASITGSNFSSWFNPIEGTINIDYRTGLKAANTRVFQINNTATPNTDAIDFVSGNSLEGGGSFLILNNGILYNTGENVGLAQRLNTVFKLTGAYRENDTATANNQLGNLYRRADTPIPSGLDQVVFAQWNFSSILCGHIQRVTYWPIRLPNITVLTLATSNTISDYPRSFSIKGKDILALKQAQNTSTCNFIFIKGLAAPAQPRITIANQNTISGVLLEQNALLKASPSSIGNYSIRSVLAANALRINGNNVASLSLSPFLATVATAPLSVFSLGLGSDLRWSPAMPSGAISSPEIAIPIDSSSFVLYAKAGQN